MKRAFILSLSVFVVGCAAGCGGGPASSGSTGGTTSPSALNGQYAFVMAGFDSTGNSMGMAGSFKADGAGHITGGAVDINDNGALSSSSALAGTYSIGTNEQGTITMTNAIAGIHTLTFAFALQTSGAFGDIMDLDANNYIIAGTMQQQNSSVFSLSSLAGDYIVTVNGRSASNPTSTLGRFTLGSTGATTNVAFDRSIAGIGTAATSGASDAITFANAAPDANGRGTLTISITDAVGGSTMQNFVYYAIASTSTSGRIIALETDATGTMTADASKQVLAGLTASTTGAVFGMAGIDTVASNEISAVGQLQIPAGTTAVVGWDSNDNGLPFRIPTLAGQAVSFNTATGRGTVAVGSGNADGLADTLVFYLSSPGTGFILDGTSGVTNRAMAGTLTAQIGSPFAIGTDFPGVALLRARASSVNDAQTFVGVFGPSTTTPFAIVADSRFPSSGTIQTQTAESIGLAASLTSATTGEGTLSTSGGETLVFFVIGPNQFVFINTTSQEGASPLFFASPQ